MRIFYAFTFAVILCFAPRANGAHIEAENGVFNFSRQAFGENQFILKGNVEFYPNQLLSHDEILNYHGTNQKYAPISGMWTGFSPDDFTNLTAQGYGTYRWRMVLKGKKHERLSFKMPIIHSAYHLYINGEKIASKGTPAKIKTEYSPELFSGIISFSAPADTLNVVLQVANFHTESGGILGAIKFGKNEVLRASHNRRIFLDFFLMGALFLAGIHFINLYFLYRRESWHLWFGITSLFGMALIATTDEFVLSYFPGLNFNFLLRAAAFSFYGLLVFITLYIWRLFSRDYNKYVAYTVVGAGSLAALGSIIAPFSFIQLINTPSLFLLILLIIYKMVVVITATRKGKRGGIYFLIGFIILIATALHDIIYELSYLVGPSYLGVGLFVFLLMQISQLNRMFVRTANRNVTLSEKLNRANKNLEREVMIRTEKLNTTVEKLTDAQKELNRKNKELEKVNDTKNKHLSIIGHDLRGPVSGIKTALELIVNDLEKGETDKEELTEMLKALSESANSAYNLLVNLFDWVRNEMNTIKYTPVNLVLRELIEETETLLKPNLEKKNLKLRIIADKNLEAFADRHMTLTILRNLLSNAIKFSHDGKKITVEVTPTQNYVEVMVSDEGIGIEESKPQNIFEYSSTKSTRGTKQEKGTGIGLILVKEFVEANKGKISVHSEKDKGSVFIFTLPVARKR